MPMQSRLKTSLVRLMNGGQSIMIQDQCPANIQGQQRATQFTEVRINLSVFIQQEHKDTSH